MMQPDHHAMIGGLALVIVTSALHLRQAEPRHPRLARAGIVVGTALLVVGSAFICAGVRIIRMMVEFFFDGLLRPTLGAA